MLLKNLIPNKNRFSDSPLYAPLIPKIYTDELDCLQLAKNGYYELLMTELMKNEVKPNDIVIDIGANIGYHTLIFSSLVGDNGFVYSIEPEPRNLELLYRNVRENNCKNVNIIPKAASNEDRFSKLYLHPDNIGDHRLYKFDNSYDFIMVEAVRLNSYFNYTSISRHVDFIKMDIQGSEFKAFLGMDKIIRANPDIKLITEFYPSALYENGVEPIEYLELLTQWEFDIYNIDEINNNIYKISISELLARYPVGSILETDLYCIRG